MLRNGPPYVDLREVVINGTTLVDCRKELLIPPGTDLMPDGQATSDQRTEADSVAGYTAQTSFLASVDVAVITPLNGTYCMRITGNGGTGSARRQITTVDGIHYVLRGWLYMPAGNETLPDFKLSDTAFGATDLAHGIMPNSPDGWNEMLVRFIAMGIDTYITIDGAADGEAFYVDDVSVTVDSPGDHLECQAFTVVTEFSDATEFLRFTPPHGPERDLSNLASVMWQADRTYEQALRYFRGSGANETDFRIILHY